MAELRDRWSVFLGIVAGPWVIALVVVDGFLGWVLTLQTDPIVVSALTLVITLFAGMVGANIMNRWSGLTGESAIKARGQTAVRGLTLLVRSIAALDRRVCEYLGRHNTGELESEVVKTYLEEIIGRCRQLQEEALSAVENWTDIPGADVKSQIGVITELADRVDVVQGEKTNLEVKLKETQGKSDKSEEDVKALEAQVQEKDAELAKVQRQLAVEGSSGIGAAISGYSLHPSLFVSGGSGAELDNFELLGTPHKKFCSDCKKEFATWSRTCPDCGGMLLLF